MLYGRDGRFFCVRPARISFDRNGYGGRVMTIQCIFSRRGFACAALPFVKHARFVGRGKGHSLSWLRFRAERVMLLFRFSSFSHTIASNRCKPTNKNAMMRKLLNARAISFNRLVFIVDPAIFGCACGQRETQNRRFMHSINASKRAASAARNETTNTNFHPKCRMQMAVVRAVAAGGVRRDSVRLRQIHFYCFIGYTLKRSIVFVPVARRTRSQHGLFNRINIRTSDRIFGR